MEFNYMLAVVASLQLSLVLSMDTKCAISQSIFDHYITNRLPYHLCMQGLVAKPTDARKCLDIQPHVGVSRLFEKQSCIRIGTDGQLATPLAPHLVSHLRANETIVCHCSGDDCSFQDREQWKHALVQSLYRSTSIISNTDIYCIRERLLSNKRVSPRTITIEVRTTTAGTTTTETTTAKMTTTETTTTKMINETKETPRLPPNDTAELKVTTEETVAIKRNVTSKTTRAELLRKLSLHLVMLSMAMLTLMLCQLVFISKVRNHYRNLPNNEDKYGVF
ncbi:hypothetical protein Q1695_007769 [Nippostrongylus brasiliensis]|nr:hypothetical protein Q1695_007769 [Nippostrongylus brasiliensis]